jgi:hypothetical protein
MKITEQSLRDMLKGLDLVEQKRLVSSLLIDTKPNTDNWRLLMHEKGRILDFLDDRHL